MPRLSRFSMLHPDTDVRLNAAVASVDLSAGEADFAIRYGTFLPAHGVAVAPFPEETFVVACAPSLAKGKRPIRKPADIEGHKLIYSEVNLVTWRDWLDGNGLSHIQTTRGPRFDRTFMAINAAVDGLGIVPRKPDDAATGGRRGPPCHASRTEGAAPCVSQPSVSQVQG
jgi:LysR family glycine cleavage system transcriptional activator